MRRGDYTYFNIETDIERFRQDTTTRDNALWKGVGLDNIIIDLIGISEESRIPP